MKKLLLGWIPLMALAMSVTGCSMLTWPVDMGSEKIEPEKKKDPVAPTGLDKHAVNPISPKGEQRTTVSRPRIVSVKKFGETQTGQRKYFEVIDKTKENRGRRGGGDAVQAVRIITYDNQAIQKDYSMSFDSVWSAAVEALLSLPLRAVDKPSGIISTEWIYDTVKKAEELDTFSFFKTDPNRARYKYTVRILGRGDVTQVKVVPFVQVEKSNGWNDARPKIVVTEKLFDRIETELSAPFPTD